MKTSLKQVNIFLSVFQVLTAFGYGFRVVTETGTDFGIYYLGGVSTSRDFELYGDFFEHKGPAYYAFIKALSYIITYGVIGSAITLTLTALVWFMCINKALAIAKIDNIPTVALVKLLSISVLFLQSSNSSIFLFGSGLAVLGVTYLMDFTVSPRFKSLMISSFLISLAILTKLDSFAILLPCLVLTLRIKKNKVQLLTIFWLCFSTTIGILLVCFSLFLPYQLKDAFYSTIEFVLTVRWNSEGVSATDLVFNKNLYTFLPLVTSGVLFTIFLLLTSFTKSKIKGPALILFSLYGLLVFLSLGSSKSYHFFDFYTFVIMGILLQPQPLVGNLKKVSYLLISYLVAISLSINISYFQEYKCLLIEPGCDTRFSTLLVDKVNAPESDYFLSQGWPYIILGRFPEVNPNVYWPLAVMTGKNSTDLIESISTSRKLMWFDLNDLKFIQENNPKLYKDLFSRMKEVGTANDGQWIAYKNQGRAQQ